MGKFAAPVMGIALLVLGATADMTGTWALDATFDDPGLGGGEADCTFKQSGEQLMGNCNGTALTGEVTGQHVRWQLQVGRPPQTTIYTGTVDNAGTKVVHRERELLNGGCRAVLAC
jgi:hypothetical protein